MSQQKGGSLVRDKLAGDVLVLPHSCYRYVRGRELHSFRTDSPYFETFPSYEYIRNTCNFTLVRATALSCFHFPDEEKGKAKRETQEERGGTGLLYRSCKAKIRASIRNDPNSGYETALRRKRQEKGEVPPFLRLFKPGSSVESANSAGGRIRVARGRPPNSAFRYFGGKGRREQSGRRGRRGGTEAVRGEFESLDTLSALEPEARLRKRRKEKEKGVGRVNKEDRRE